MLDVYPDINVASAFSKCRMGEISVELICITCLKDFVNDIRFILDMFQHLYMWQKIA
jgi:hypothetical protein